MCTDKILEKTVSFKHNTNLRFKKNQKENDSFKHDSWNQLGD